MYELIILSTLMTGQAHGYSIAQTINSIIGPIAKASNGRIYPLLAKLEKQGFVKNVVKQINGRQQKVFTLTPTGKERFFALMLDTESNPKEYQELFSFKVTVFDLLQQEKRLQLTEHYVEYCEAHIEHLKKGVEASSSYLFGEDKPSYLNKVMTHRINQWQVEKEWALTIKKQLEEDLQ
ncbi:PadR family transcriptional regulator [Paenalkalicoccus suaedae]|uniref:PadR family transcriptional regulator n=1 Tax=Paenalkalicoccus suaedae TaxID=2592382 RepID=A0A859FJF5_9BACI|nr:PadR family transcriptional regulator [Paenalkalicoccus suaedae]QKS72931.1 PadR family transcriptional regulator [Paenalkalicoccus suaedae]